ncbi:uncharacterized protein LOC121105059 [Ursus maritimus]|uniref:Uncharacterized protein LOC121105059 n=1 Tax=Ursus maritimus TaxID=29073 RepID=A0A8M1GN41_URSMA|nr:uncharacterized protein LOC121105059 [Ursus maritimus]
MRDKKRPHEDGCGAGHPELQPTRPPCAISPPNPRQPRDAAAGGADPSRPAVHGGRGQLLCYRREAPAGVPAAPEPQPAPGVTPAARGSPPNLVVPGSLWSAVLGLEQRHPSTQKSGPGRGLRAPEWPAEATGRVSGIETCGFVAVAIALPTALLPAHARTDPPGPLGAPQPCFCAAAEVTSWDGAPCGSSTPQADAAGRGAWRPALCIVFRAAQGGCGSAPLWCWWVWGVPPVWTGRGALLCVRERELLCCRTSLLSVLSCLGFRCVCVCVCVCDGCGAGHPELQPTRPPCAISPPNPRQPRDAAAGGADPSRPAVHGGRGQLLCYRREAPAGVPAAPEPQPAPGVTPAARGSPPNLVVPGSLWSAVLGLEQRHPSTQKSGPGRGLRAPEWPAEATGRVSGIETCGFVAVAIALPTALLPAHARTDPPGPLGAPQPCFCAAAEVTSWDGAPCGSSTPQADAAGRGAWRPALCIVFRAAQGGCGSAPLWCWWVWGVPPVWTGRGALLCVRERELLCCRTSLLSVLSCLGFRCVCVCVCVCVCAATPRTRLWLRWAADKGNPGEA